MNETLSIFTDITVQPQNHKKKGSQENDVKNPWNPGSQNPLPNIICIWSLCDISHAVCRSSSSTPRYK